MVTRFRLSGTLYEIGYVTGTFFSLEKILGFGCFRVWGFGGWFVGFFGKLKCKLDLYKKKED